MKILYWVLIAKLLHERLVHQIITTKLLRMKIALKLIASKLWHTNITQEHKQHKSASQKIATEKP